jgi:hypothetical protein
MKRIDALLVPIYRKTKAHAGKKPSGIAATKKGKKSKPTERVDVDKVLSLFREKITNAKFLPSRNDGQTTYEKRRAVVGGYRTLLDSMNATHFFTFMPGYFVKPETIAANIIKFCCRLERKALGRKWFKLKKNRIRLIGFLEHPDSTPHYHAIVHVPQYTESALDEFGAEIWKTLMPSGKFEGEPILDNARRYSSKDLHHGWSPENVVIYKPIPRKA